MSNIDLQAMTRKFLMGESKDNHNVFAYIQALQETLKNFSPKSKTESRRLNIARDQLKEIKRHTRRLQNEVELLQEKLVLLEEQVGIVDE
jgi:hypothetical protein